MIFQKRIMGTQSFGRCADLITAMCWSNHRDLVSALQCVADVEIKPKLFFFPATFSHGVKEKYLIKELFGIFFWSVLGSFLFLWILGTISISDSLVLCLRLALILILLQAVVWFLKAIAFTNLHNLAHNPDIIHPTKSHRILNPKLLLENSCCPEYSIYSCIFLQIFCKLHQSVANLFSIPAKSLPRDICRHSARNSSEYNFDIKCTQLIWSRRGKSKVKVRRSPNNGWDL